MKHFPTTHRQIDGDFGALTMAADMCIVIDVETTGLDPRNERIIEIGAAAVRAGQITHTYHRLVNPGREIPCVVEELTGIRTTDVERAGNVGTALEELDAFVREVQPSDGREMHFVGHNVGFDLSFLKAEADRSPEGNVRLLSSYIEECPTVCTAEFSRMLITREDVGRYRLANVAEHLQTPHNPSHRALDDVYTTYEVLQGLLRLAHRR